MTAPAKLRIGTAGWTIPRQHAAGLPAEGSHLARYAQVFNAAEINSSFHRPHRRSTYERWAAAVPDGFLFAVKVPKAITHELRLIDAEAALDAFAAEIAGLGDRLGPLLVQLPPKLAFDQPIVRTFFHVLRERHGGALACEPRHASWFAAEADALLRELRVSRVAADPVVAGGSPEPGGWPGLLYLRLHGAPRMYYSDYQQAEISALAARLAAAAPAAEKWCVFDNTASGAALGNALALREEVFSAA